MGYHYPNCNCFHEIDECRVWWTVDDAMQFQKFFLKHSAYAGKWWVGEVWRKTNDPTAWMGVINVRYCDNYADALAELRDRIASCSPDD